MRISGVENNPVTQSSQPLDSKILKLIEQLAARPLLIEKLTLTEQKPLELALAGQTTLKQLQMPSFIAKHLSEIAQTAMTVSISTKNNQIIIDLAPNNKAASETSTRLVFNQATLITPTTLKVFQQISKTEQTSTVQANEQQKINNGTTAQQTTLTRSNSLENRSPLSSEYLTLKQAIKELLTNHSHNSPQAAIKLSDSFNQLIKLENNLLESLNIQNMSKRNNPPQQLNTQPLRELLVKTSRLPIKDPILSPITKLLQLTQKLRQLTDFSVSNKSLDIKQRMTTGGHFFESKLSKQSSQFSISNHKNLNSLDSPNRPATSSIQPEKIVSLKANKTLPELTNSPKQLPDNQPKANNDIKQVSLQIKQVLEQLSQSLKIPQNKAVNIQRVVALLTKSPEFNALATAIQSNTTATSLSSTTSATQPLSPTQTITSSQTTVPSPSIETKQLFQSKELNELFSANSLKTLQQAQPLSLKQNHSLLKIQLQMVESMLLEVNQVLNKIEHNQLLSLKNESQFLQQYLVDLPIYHKGQIDSFELLYEAERDTQQDKANKTWTVTVKFDLEPLGPMFARVKLKNDRISTQFFAQEESTTQLLEQHIERLKSSLLLAGLEVDEVKSKQGKVPETLLKDDDVTVDLHV
ncbi:flagellar hook-length control protein FliK [Aliikangiella sp. IMCC44359]|uniref:flagellar hook-length control protein FliK n=1 Tax=Aliikangiella sp. IMCC44359 TaxID=3459125 RepID=UPI00403B166A